MEAFDVPIVDFVHEREIVPPSGRGRVLGGQASLLGLAAYAEALVGE
jgi:hypothetical protein